MVVDVAPSLGQGAVPLQAGPGATVGYGAIDHRRMWTIGLQEGAIDAGSYKVKQNSAGAAMNVDVDANIEDGLVIQGDDVAVQGRYYVAPHSAKMNITIDAADVTNPRLDQVVAEVEDDTHDSSSLNKARVRIVKGTPTAAATLDNRNGAAALPNGCMRLADVLVGAGVTTITTANIRDRRAWARGAHWLTTRSAGNYTVAVSTMTELDGTNLKPRIECSGVPLRVSLLGTFNNNAATATTYFRPMLDGSPAVSGTTDVLGGASATANAILPAGLSSTFVPTAGSHQVHWNWRATSGTSVLLASSASPVVMVVEELVTQNASND